ncbi:hypothetical protein EAH78_32065 [Pseudomonas arsenicoxydans]|uniref:Uncharacterized protein n=1 Tax=Pseudomonas arsenicoxydans TaxID=702115 RepID=A0A502GPU1_9PSED|nr:hypothetical protein EAH78_32065 [Pseudomonas arsenicoxydans]
MKITAALRTETHRSKAAKYLTTTMSNRMIIRWINQILFTSTLTDKSMRRVLQIEHIAAIPLVLFSQLKTLFFGQIQRGGVNRFFNAS